MVCVLTNKKNVKRERRERTKEAKEKKQTKNNRQRETLPEKKRSKKRDKNSLFFSLPLGGGVWCSSVVVLIIILRITTTIKASESCNSSRALSKEAKERSTGKRELFRTE